MIIRYLLLLLLYTYGTILQAEGSLLTEDYTNSVEFHNSDLYMLPADNKAFTIKQSFNSLNYKVTQVFNSSSSDKFQLASNHANKRALKSTTYGIKDAYSEARHALVIGNSNYTDSPLQNPVNDANAISQYLASLGFEVSALVDVDNRSIISAIRNFGEKITESGGVGLFYYAGHAMQIKGKNYLMPIDADIRKESDVKYEAVDVGRVLDEMEQAKNRVNIVILDACRNNPFARSFRSTNSGLAQMDAPSGTLISYATAPGMVAEDGNDINGTYTKHLLKQMLIPDLPLEKVFKRVRKGVMEETNDSQTPWESSSLVGEFYFSGGDSEIKIKEQDIPTLTVKPVNKEYQQDTLGKLFEVDKPWYKRWYVWAGIVAAAVLISCGGGDSATADGGGSSGC